MASMYFSTEPLLVTVRSDFMTAKTSRGHLTQLVTNKHHC